LNNNVLVVDVSLLNSGWQ